jgi:hypothetical protein
MESIDSQLVIACHCAVHPPVYYVKDGHLDAPVGPEAVYVDPACPDDTWAKIAPASKTYVWGINCPVALQIGYAEPTATGALLSILAEAWNVLQGGGQVIFPGKYDMNIVGRVQEKINSDPLFVNKWQFSMVKTEDYAFTLAHVNKYRGTPIVHPVLAIFTKPVGSGGRKRRTRDRKRSQRRARTRK